jgi:hypothetical protein
MVDSPPVPPQEQSSELSTREQFDQVLGQVKLLLSSGALYWRLAGAGTITPRLDDDEVTRSVGPRGGPERQVFEQVLTREIVPAINRAARMPAPWESIFMVFHHGELSASVREEQSRRQKLIARELYDDGLQQRVFVRRTSKGSALEDIRWDISIKKHDLRTGGVPDVPYATIELIYLETTAGTEGAPSFLAMSAPRRTITFDCHLHDLDALLKDLNDLRANLQKLAAAPAP